MWSISVHFYKEHIFLATVDLHVMSSAADPMVPIVQVGEAESTAPSVTCLHWIPQILYDVMTTVRDS